MSLLKFFFSSLTSGEEEHFVQFYCIGVVPRKVRVHGGEKVLACRASAPTT